MTLKHILGTKVTDIFKEPQAFNLGNCCLVRLTVVNKKAATKKKKKATKWMFKRLKT